MSRYLLLFCMAGICFAGCRTGGHTEDNSLVIMEIGRRTGSVQVRLAGDYGFLIDWVDNHEPELYLYDKPAHSIEMTRDVSVFFTGLERFPDGAKVDWVRGCATTLQGMPEEVKARLHEIIRIKEFRLTSEKEGNFTVCTCESTYERRFTEAEP
jgi:hypothetical protein